MCVFWACSQYVMKRVDRIQRCTHLPQKMEKTQKPGKLQYQIRYFDFSFTPIICLLELFN